MKKLKMILRYRYVFKIVCVIAIIYSLLLAFYFPIKSKYSNSTTEIIGQVINYEFDGNKLKLTLEGKEKIIIYYYFKTKDEKEKYQNKIELGMALKINGNLELPKKNTIPNGFNYRNYLKYKHINYSMNATNIKIIENNTSILYYIKNKMVKRIDKIDSKGYLKTFILGDKSILDGEMVEIYQQNGVSHLFSISGMHVSLIVGMIMFFLNKVSYSNLYKYGITISILIFYLFLTGIGASILRTIIMFIVFAINKCFNLEIKRIDLMLIVLVISIIIAPFIIYDMGFQFSYSISFTLVVFHKKISKTKNKFMQSLYTSFISFLVSFPICIYYYSKVNILSIFLNIIMIPFVSVLVFPLTLVTFVIPVIYPIYEMIIIFLENISAFFSNITTFELMLSKPLLVVLLMYYIIIFLSIYNYKYLILFVLLIFIHKNYLYIDNSMLFTALDVGQGDSLFIKLPNNKANIMIDTGGEIKAKKEKWQESKSKYSIVKNKTIPYFRSLGINKIQYLIITHGDYDHMGEAINLVDNFKVEKVIFNKGEFNDLELEFIKVLDDKNIPYYQNIKELNIGEYKLYFLNNRLYDNENDNSNVIYMKANNYKFLLMGDAGVDVEREIISKYNLNNIDILKVGHHGSKTSSSEGFINEINPRYSIISVGKNNRYGHPNNNVLDNLEDSKIYRTDRYGSIMFNIKKDKLKIETCAP